MRLLSTLLLAPGAALAPIERRSLFKGAALSSAVGAAPALAKTSGVGGPTVKLSDGTNFPMVSFGLQVYDDEAAYKYTTLALECGYRNFFASVLAGNQKGFGRAVRASGIPRDELYVCGSVLSNRARGEEAAFQATRRGCEANFRDLDVGKLDMIMLDYPGPDDESIQGQWRGMEKMRTEGGVASLAVSNYSPAQLDVVLRAGGGKPCVNQLPVGVGYKPKLNAELLSENRKRGVLVQAWSPLRVISPRALEACAAVGRPYGKTAQQVALKRVLVSPFVTPSSDPTRASDESPVREDCARGRLPRRWILAKGATYTCQTTSKKHFQEDIDVFDFELSAKDLAALEGV